MINYENAETCFVKLPTLDDNLRKQPNVTDLLKKRWQKFEFQNWKIELKNWISRNKGETSNYFREQGNMNLRSRWKPLVPGTASSSEEALDNHACPFACLVLFALFLEVCAVHCMTKRTPVGVCSCKHWIFYAFITRSVHLISHVHCISISGNYRGYQTLVWVRIERQINARAGCRINQTEFKSTLPEE